MANDITSAPARRAERRRLDTLKTHPKQQEYFRASDEREIERLARDITANGLKHPVEVLDDGTIVCGHQRVAAATKLGWSEIDVIVREDLDGRGDGKVEEALIGDNLHRRQLDPIEKARCIKRLYELRQREASPKKSTNPHEGTFRDHLGKEFGISGRTVDRYVNALKAPRAVQAAVSAGKLSVAEAAKVACLEEPVKEKVVEAITSGTEPKEAIRHCVKKRPGKDLAIEPAASLASGLPSSNTR